MSFLSEPYAYSKLLFINLTVPGSLIMCENKF